MLALRVPHPLSRAAWPWGERCSLARRFHHCPLDREGSFPLRSRLSSCLLELRLPSSIRAELPVIIYSDCPGPDQRRGTRLQKSTALVCLKAGSCGRWTWEGQPHPSDKLTSGNQGIRKDLLNIPRGNFPLKNILLEVYFPRI